MASNSWIQACWAAPEARLEVVLRAYAALGGQRDGSPVAVALHGGDHVARAHERLRDFVVGLVEDGVRTGGVRADVPAGELAAYVMAAMSAANVLSDAVAQERLVELVLAGLRPRT